MNTIATAQKTNTAKTQSILDRWSEALFYYLIAKIVHGQISVIDGSRNQKFGADNAELSAEIKILDHTFYRRVVWGGSIGAGEAYVEGLWESENLTNLIRIMALNIGLLNKIEQRFSWLFQPLTTLKHQLNSNSKSGSKKNILSHYDLGNEMYQSFLDPTMMYSSAIYPNSSTSLEEASVHKLEEICKKLDLKSTDHLIEIGTGWGGFAIHAAKNYGCHVTTTTISDAQFKEAEKRIKAEGLEQKITLLKKDYRELDGEYDKLVSIEMIEAVGEKYLSVFFRKCSNLLKKDGKMLIQAITIRDQTYKQYARSVDFIQKHIFPGGFLPSNSMMLDILAKKTDLVVRKIDDFGFDYARTLQDWRERFNASFDTIKQYGFDDAFKRLWNFYLCYSEGGFRERTVSVVHILATKPGNRD